MSRTHPSLIRRLFELEVPEIADGVVTIKSVAREPGARSKIAVMSRDEKVDPVGACVGHRGSRVQAVVNELYDEKIDIVRWNADNSQFISESLSPAKAVKVHVNEPEKSALVVVPDSQLSLAIGKAGQNVRLAARLTGWRIDIRSEAQIARAQLQSLPDAGEGDEEIGLPIGENAVSADAERIGEEESVSGNGHRHDEAEFAVPAETTGTTETDTITEEAASPASDTSGTEAAAAIAELHDTAEAQ